MVNPLAALAVNAGTQITRNILDRISTPSASSTSFEAELSAKQINALEKLIASHPEVKEALGQGPYTLKLQDGALTLSGSNGQQIKLDTASALGQKFAGISGDISLKYLQKGLELRAV
jgi:hypothetical protein